MASEGNVGPRVERKPPAKPINVWAQFNGATTEQQLAWLVRILRTQLTPGVLESMLADEIRASHDQFCQCRVCRPGEEA